MKVGRLLLGTLVLLHCNIFQAQEPSKIICEKGIFPSPSPPKEGMIPLTEENDLDDATTQPSDTDQNQDQNKDQNSQPPPSQSLEKQQEAPSGNGKKPNVQKYGQE